MFGKKYPLMRLLGFPIFVDLSWIVLAVLVTWSFAVSLFPARVPGESLVTYWILGAAAALLLFLSIVVHELGHAVVARRFGIPIRGITLFIFGGVAELESEPPTAKSEFWMAIAGPLVSVGVAVLLYGVYGVGTALELSTPILMLALVISGINLMLALFNMIPAFPLDGGRVLRAFLWHRKGSLEQATRISSTIGSGFGLFLILIGVFSLMSGDPLGGMWRIVIGLFLREAARASYFSVQIRSFLEGIPVGRIMRSEPVTVTPWITVSDFVQDYVYRYHHEMYPVMNRSDLVGCVDLKAVRRLPQSEWPKRTISDIMSDCSEANTVTPQTDAAQLLRVISSTGNARFLVKDGERLVGLVTVRDLTNYLSLKLDLEGSPRAVPEQLVRDEIEQERLAHRT
jgi:Zn-dependent protease/predicted transcriptional regulator